MANEMIDKLLMEANKKASSKGKLAIDKPNKTPIKTKLKPKKVKKASKMKKAVKKRKSY